jgi:uncharacterized protein HemX
MAKMATRDRWSFAEDRRLIQLAASLKSLEAVADQMKLTPERVAQMAKRLGVPLKTGAEDWTPAEAERLLKLAKRGTSAARAAQLLGRRIGSVRRQAKVLGILLYKK